MLEWLGLPVAASSHAGDVYRIMVLVHWLMVTLFVGWGSFFIYVLYRFRRGRNPRASYAGARGRFASLVKAACSPRRSPCSRSSRSRSGARTSMPNRRITTASKCAS